MAKRKARLKPAQNYQVPLQFASWSTVKSYEGVELIRKLRGDSAGFVVVAGGKGREKQDCQASISCASYQYGVDDFSAERFTLAEDELPSSLAVEPNGDGVVVAFSNSCKHYDLNFFEDEKLVLSDRKMDALQGVGKLGFLRFSPNGNLLAAGGVDKTLRVLAWPTMSLLQDVEQAHHAPLKDADFSLDGSLLATTAEAGPARIWDIAGELTEPIAILPLDDKVAGAKFGYCRFSRDLKKPLLFTTVTKGGKGYIMVWNMATWQSVGVKLIHDEPITSFELSSNGRMLATGTASGNIVITEIKLMSKRQTFRRAHGASVEALEFSPNSRALLSVSGDGTARITALKRYSDDFEIWQIYAMMLCLLILSIPVGLGFNYYGQWFWKFPMGHNQTAYPPIEALLGDEGEV